MTDALVHRCTPYPSIDDYLEGYAITGAKHEHPQVPCHLLTASDDPIIPVQDLARLAPSSFLEITVTARGGHSGFIESLGAQSWANEFVLAKLSQDPDTFPHAPLR